MDFELSDEQRLLRDTVRDFAREQLAPGARARDGAGRFPIEMVPALAAMGLLGMSIPERFGGAGMSAVSSALVVEELARADASLAMTVASHDSLCCAHILLAGSQQQKERTLPRLASGEWLGAWAQSEQPQGSALARPISAQRHAGGWTLRGVAPLVCQGSMARLFVLVASTAPAAAESGQHAERQSGAQPGAQSGAQPHGLTAFLVDAGSPGVKVGEPIETLGMRAAGIAGLTLEQVEVGDEDILGGVGQASPDLARVLDGNRIASAALAVGLGRGALEDALRYSGERIQFGQPIASFQAIQWMLADMATEIDAARSLVWHAGWLRDQGLRCARQAAMARLLATQAAQRACDAALQIHGGYGYTREYAAERALRDAKQCELGAAGDDGSGELGRLLIVRGLLGDAASGRPGPG